MSRHVAHRRAEDELAAQLAAERVEILVRVDDGDDRFARHRPVGAWGPGFRVGDERIAARGQRVGGEALALPAAAKGPGLLMDVGQPPVLHRLHRPVAGFLHVGRAGQSRAVDVSEVALDLHHFGALEPFVFDAVERIEIDLLRHRQLGGERQGDEHGDTRA